MLAVSVDGVTRVLSEWHAAGRPLDYATSQADDIVYALLIEKATYLCGPAASPAIDDNLFICYSEKIQVEWHQMHW